MEICYLIYIKWGVTIKGKSIVISLILLTMLVLSVSVAFAATDDSVVGEIDEMADEDVLLKHHFLSLIQ